MTGTGIPTLLQFALLAAGGYLLGSIPTAYLAGRWLKGIDLRRHGSGTVSGSMVYEHVARWAIVPVGLFDLFKAWLPAWLTLHLRLGEAAAAAAGLAAVMGHNWPLYLGFTGGRGLSPYMGLLLAIFPWGFPWVLAFLAIGFVLGDSAPWALACLATLPVFAGWLGAPPAVGGSALAMLVITLAKRLQANGRPLPEDDRRRCRVLLLRTFFDRDIPSHREWLQGKRDGR